MGNLWQSFPTILWIAPRRPPLTLARVSGRRTLPHEPPLWVDPSREVWFLTLKTQPPGLNQLAKPDIAQFIFESVAFRTARLEWFPHVFLLMPDHCHALVSFPQEGRAFEHSVRQWKRWIATQRGVQWQIDFFDHRLRREESFDQQFQYLLDNPIRAGLAARWEEWPYFWFPPEDVFTGLHR